MTTAHILAEGSTRLRGGKDAPIRLLFFPIVNVDVYVRNLAEGGGNPLGNMRETGGVDLNRNFPTDSFRRFPCRESSRQPKAALDVPNTVILLQGGMRLMLCDTGACLLIRLSIASFVRARIRDCAVASYQPAMLTLIAVDVRTVSS